MLQFVFLVPLGQEIDNAPLTAPGLLCLQSPLPLQNPLFGHNLFAFLCY